jgi:hypothetical protein
MWYLIYQRMNSSKRWGEKRLRAAKKALAAAALVMATVATVHAQAMAVAAVAKPDFPQSSLDKATP